MPLWRKAHVQLKMHKAHHVRTTFEDQMSKKGTLLVKKNHSLETTFGRSERKKERKKDRWMDG